MFYNLTTILLNRIQRLKHVGNIKLEGCGFKPCQLSDTVLFFSNTRTKFFFVKIKVSDYGACLGINAVNILR